ncbi:histidine kinase [Methylophaga sp. OBS4]|uniref:histidine kinase n=1 Tax=Methylophaga sp. OBS4 TaxID=2991935 RepID=UPI00225A6ADC|nr:histidine kinase [Methylophaga sp. OBS4]MCX4187068.1 histidine kinase [Methylophaga sp. OBS4]
MVTKLKQISALIGSFSRRTLYAKLMLLLFCITLTVLLMQSGTIFLLDYIPSSQSAIDKISSQKVYWHRQLSYMKAIKLEAADATLKDMQQHYLDTADPEVLWMLRQDNPEVLAAVRKVEREQQNFSDVAKFNVRVTAQLRMAERVAESYDELDKALHRDNEAKRSIIGLLQAISLIFVFSCILAIVIGGRRLLVERLDNLTSFINIKSGDASHRAAVDEFATLEHRVSELTAQLEGFESEVTWAHRTSEHVRVLIRAQDFILRFIETVSENVLSERTMLKMLYALERALGFTNAALIYTDDAAVISTERIIFSHHKPQSLTDEIFDELLMVGVATYEYTNADDERIGCLGVTFSGVSNGIGVLLVEMEQGRFLEDSEIKVLEITARLLGMVAKFQGHDEEGRRLAVLEERAAIARELHDSLAQSLSFMKIQVARLQSKNNDEKQMAVVSELREGLDNAYRELRELLTTFRVHMDLRGLGYAIQATIDEFSQRSPLTITLDNRLVNCRLTVNEEFHILHVVREALSNIVRHSGAKNVSILMMLQKNGSVELTIDDDGVGFTPASTTHDHHGQAIMKERANTLGGDIEVMARRYGGTRVRLSFMPKLAQ